MAKARKDSGKNRGSRGQDGRYLPGHVKTGGRKKGTRNKAKLSRGEDEAAREVITAIAKAETFPEQAQIMRDLLSNSTVSLGVLALVKKLVPPAVFQSGWGETQTDAFDHLVAVLQALREITGYESALNHPDVMKAVDFIQVSTANKKA